MNNLKSVNILGHVYPLRPKKRPLDEGFIGRLDRVGGEIRLDKRACPEWQARILLHEVAHDWADLNDLRGGERLVKALSLCVFSFIRDNPALVKAIQKSKAILR